MSNKVFEQGNVSGTDVKRGCYDKKGGFTLIELLVIIAIIAILMAILMPALNRVKEQGKRATCLYNLKQLSLCWIMYADENEDKIINGDNGEWATVAMWGSVAQQ